MHEGKEKEISWKKYFQELKLTTSINLKW
jgi:hypothetical protein